MKSAVWHVVSGAIWHVVSGAIWIGALVGVGWLASALAGEISRALGPPIQ